MESLIKKMFPMCKRNITLNFQFFFRWVGIEKNLYLYFCYIIVGTFWYLNNKYLLITVRACMSSARKRRHHETRLIIFLNEPSS